MKKTLLLALSLTVAAYSAQAQAVKASASTAKVAGPAISFEESKFDFGSTGQGAVVEHTFKFKNTGTAPLVISNIGVSCGCTTPEWTKAPVQPGKTGSITAKFNTAGKIGMQNKVLTIESNATAGSSTVSLVGEVKEAGATANAAPQMKADVVATPGAKATIEPTKIKEKTDDSKFKAKVK